ncbi:hypothetical protein [Microbacterium sp. A8/3-1]|uniref:hypothetical protein n=1 Tax=Microbacterium sp. A8/3-1 TaxID=3160749 RepID=UPI0033134912
MRRGELCGLDWSAVDLASRTLRVERREFRLAPASSNRRRRQMAASERSHSMMQRSGRCSLGSSASRRSATSGARPGSTPATSSPWKTGRRSSPIT